MGMVHLNLYGLFLCLVIPAVHATIGDHRPYLLFVIVSFEAYIVNYTYQWKYTRNFANKGRFEREDPMCPSNRRLPKPDRTIDERVATSVPKLRPTAILSVSSQIKLEPRFSKMSPMLQKHKQRSEPRETIRVSKRF